MSGGDVAVVGAGPGGGTAALWLARCGVAVTLVDAEPDAGGAGLSGRDGDRLRGDLRRVGLDWRRETEVVDYGADGRLTLADGQGALSRLSPRMVIAAPGAAERHLPVAGWTLPGVFGLGALQLLNKRDRVVPQGRVVLVGAGPLLRLTAAELLAARVWVVGMVDAGPRLSPALVAGLALRPGALVRGIGLEARRLLAGVPLVRGWPTIFGDGLVHAVRVGETRIEAEVVGLGCGLQPDTELFRLAGAAVEWEAEAAWWRVCRDARLETTRPGLFAVGDGAALGGADVAAAEGVVAAAEIARRLGVVLPPGLLWAERRARLDLPRLRLAARALARWSRVELPDDLADGTVLCRCEGVTVGQVRAALAQGYGAPGPLKLATRAGMGRCQGRVCGAAVQALAQKAGNPPLPSRVRPPLRPLPAAQFGGDTQGE